VPFDHARTIGYVHELRLPADDEQAVLGGNARALFRLG
jgi:predicted TIM-barrel fold metal-dependent hydrolase